MFKHIILALGALVAASAFAAVDINKASQAELEAVKGIGPAMAEKMLAERKKAPFKDWNDVTTRVKGVGDASASKFSQNGLTVNGSAFTGPTAAGTAKAATAAGIKQKVDAAHAAAATK
jgi:competence protein ComEA